ncbi:hypothetical protein LMT8_07085 [Leuconostoc mesenteroides subsp. cremoris TIFN8]|nr:hypothetical protein LMT8_07085 [Leuconostoc mesenteroides subsp. cremoris TIFN8]
MKTVTKVMSDGTKIVYDEYGNDQLKTVFLLHGNGSSAHCSYTKKWTIFIQSVK